MLQLVGQCLVFAGDGNLGILEPGRDDLEDVGDDGLFVEKVVPFLPWLIRGQVFCGL